MEEKENLNIKNRIPKGFENSLRIYKAKAYDNCGIGDDRIQVRILPYMIDIPKTELDNLPKYPPLIRGQTLKVLTEKDFSEKASILWVLAVPDFTYGFVLGEANFFESCLNTKMDDSWPFVEVKKHLNMINAMTPSFDYKNIQVDLRNATGTYTEFHNILSGEKWMLTSHGDIIHISSGKILLQASQGYGSSDSKSNLLITPKKITFNTDLFEVNAKKLLLGAHSHNLVGTSAPFGGVSCDGMNLQPISNIYV